MDYEVTPSFVLSVTVSDGSLTSAATVTVNLEDVDETVNQAPQIATQTFWVDENSSDGTVVGTLSAGDPDGDAITFSISAGSNAFNISSAGVLTVADSAQLDYESTQTLTISVQVNDGELTASATITIHINDVLDTNVAPTITDQVFNVKENSFIGYVVGDLGAEDANGDVLSFTLAGNNGGTFSISDDGNLIVADNTLLDFESGLTFSLTVTVSDGALSSSATVTVNITDVDETVNQAPQISNATFTIEENSIFGYLVGKVRAGDPDNDPLSFAIVSGNIGNAFAISSDGVISVADQSQLDYETIQKFELTVSVSDGALADSAFVVIRLADVDESVNQAPQITPQTFSVDENSPIGTIVGTVTAGDPNGDAITFSMNGSTAFAISTNGQISVADITQLDFETTPSFTFTVEVSDGELTASATITVELNDLDESVTNEAPVIADQVFSINENSAVGTAVGTVLATDPEGAPLTYTIVDTTASFAINSATGLITVMSAALLDFETRPSFSVTVEVNDGELSALAVVTINLLDVDEVTNTAPVITDQNFSIDENSANNTVVGTVDAEDPDGNVLSFMITGGNAAGAFGINETSGEILVADESLLDFETTPSFELTVEVSDGELSASATITISLNDLDEGALSTDEGFDVRIYPNPATDIVTLEAHAGLVGGDAVILSVSGEVVYSFSVRSTNQLNIANLPAGIYLIKMVKKDVEMIHRLHKVK